MSTQIKPPTHTKQVNGQRVTVDAAPVLDPISICKPPRQQAAVAAVAVPTVQGAAALAALMGEGAVNLQDALQVQRRREGQEEEEVFGGE